MWNLYLKTKKAATPLTTFVNLSKNAITMEDQTRKPMLFGYHSIPESSQFVPRDAEMQRLEQLLLPTDDATGRRKVGVIHGLGGIGKTELAIAFAQRNQSNYDEVTWLDGSSEQRLKESFVDVAQRLPQDDQQQASKKFWKD